jgi:hypothetical protein
MGATTHQQMPCSYTDAEIMLRRRGGGTIHGLRGTTIGTHTCGIAVYYHGTPVVIFCKDGSAIINSGGHRSMTTKCRINDALRAIPFRVYQRNFEWLVARYGEADEGVPFADWMRVVPRESNAKFRARLAAEALGAGRKVA